MLHTLLVALLGVTGCGVEALVSSKAEYYTQNAICRQSNCVNPIFPGLNDLPRLEQIVWQCTTHDMVSKFVDFCGEVVNYDPALPSPNSTSQPLDLIVKQQDDAAATMFFYHLSGLGYEAGEFRTPSKSSDECVKDVWRMACYTYFPKVEAGCKPGEGTPYLRPCKNCCERYASSCQVECCDESVQCVFQHLVAEGGTATALVQTGYVDAVGPSALCTGSGGRRLGSPVALLLGILAAHAAAAGFTASGKGSCAGDDRERRRLGAVTRGSNSGGFRRLRDGLLLAAVAAVCALAIQGCDVEVPHHEVGNWRKKPDYLVSFEFIRPGQPASSATLNSCSEGVPDTLRCSGRGYCKEWSSTSTAPVAVSFCECDRDWADPECRTRRKSQITAFLCSLFGGFLGADYFYLGYPFWGLAKLATLGGLGSWWLLDVVRTGSGPVYAYNFRVANDLPHWIYVLSTVTIFGVAGFLLAIESYLTYRKQKREDVLKLQESEEARHLSKMDDLDDPRYRLGVGARGFDGRRGEFSGYGATLPGPLPNAGAPYAVPPPPPGEVGRFAGPFGHVRGPGAACAWR